MKRIITTIVVAVISIVSAFAQISVKYHGEINAGYSVGIGTYAADRV